VGEILTKEQWKAWVPDAAHINALPEALRRYVHDLATRCDPAGDIQTIAVLREQLGATEHELQQAEGERDELWRAIDKEGSIEDHQTAYEIAQDGAAALGHLAGIEQLQRERDAALAQVTKLRKALERALRELGGQHSGHWDSTGGHGSGCPVCIHEGEVRDELRAVLSLAPEPREARPEIVCICGSTRFKQSWISENARLTSEGYIVLAVGLWGHHERQDPPPVLKAHLDDLHLRKIELADWVWVLDVGGYVGDSTRREITHAEQLGKPVRYLSHEFPGYVEPADQSLSRISAEATAAERERICRFVEQTRIKARLTGRGSADDLLARVRDALSPEPEPREEAQ